jgi:transcriptional regulator with XRE-family HTH domain
MRMAGEPTLGQLLRGARGASSQENLAQRLGIKKQAVSAMERGQRVPSLSLLLRVHAELTSSGVAGGYEPLEWWLVAWIEAEASQKCDRAVLPGFEEAAAHLRAHLPGGRAGRGNTLLLQNFPDAFYPLTVIGGDRRESTPKSVADMFIYSGAVTDLTSLPGLLDGRKVSIRSDKLAVVLDEQTLNSQLGHSNLLILGSPAANWVARLVNHQAIFRFAIPDERRMWTEQLLRELRRADAVRLRILSQVIDILGRDRPEPNLKKLRDHLPANQIAFVDWAVATAEQLLAGHTPKQIMNEFRGGGIVDPIDRHVHGLITGEHNDFALVSLAPNPFSRTGDFVAVLVAGIHGPGTTHALRALTTEPSFFEHHPLGGVLEITMERFVDWSTRFQNAFYSWQTQRYDLSTLRQRLEDEPPRDGGIAKLLALIDRVEAPPSESELRYR